MKKIVKGPEPPELAKWKADNAHIPENLRYGSLHGEQTIAIRKQMLVEQGYICAYTMIRVSDEHHCHLEHIIPQSQEPARDLEYTNMLACFPGRQTDEDQDHSLTENAQFFGAKLKDNTHISGANFISPCDNDVEQKFLYRLTGEIEAAGGDPAAISTIAILGLGHPSLCDIRRATFEGEGITRFSESPLSSVAAREFAASILNRDSDGRFPAYCLAIAHAAIEYAELEEAAAMNG